MSRAGLAFARGRIPNTLRTESGLLQLMVHRPITDGAAADISAEGAGGAEPGPSNGHGGCGACIDQVVVPTAPPRPCARNRDAVHHRVVNERRLPELPKSRLWVRKHIVMYAKEALVTIAVCITYMYVVFMPADF